MASKVISFRLSDAEIQALSAQKAESDSSLNQTAVRLLRDILGTDDLPKAPLKTSTGVDIREIVRQEIEAAALSTSSTPVDISEVVRQEVSAAIASFRQEVDERLGEFAASLAEGESLGQESKPDYETIRDRTLGRLKMGRQSVAGKAIDAFIKEVLKG